MKNEKLKVWIGYWVGCTSIIQWKKIAKTEQNEQASKLTIDKRY